MNKFARLVSALVALFGRKTRVTAPSVKRTITGGYNILLLAAENRRVKHDILALKDSLESVNAWGEKVANNAIAYAAENALLKERIARLEDENRWLAGVAAELLDAIAGNEVGYKDVRPEYDGTFWEANEASDDTDGDGDTSWDNLHTDGDDYSEWDNLPLYGFKSVKTARYHCRGCRRVEKYRGHRCGKK